MPKLFYISLLIISFGLILKPNESYSCKVKKVVNSKISEMNSCCKKQDSKSADHEKAVDYKCCEKLKKTEPVSEKSHHDCDGHCKHNSCSCASLSFSVNLPQIIDLKLDTLILDSENATISHDENRLPSGFHSIWLPPVIS